MLPDEVKVIFQSRLQELLDLNPKIRYIVSETIKKAIDNEQTAPIFDFDAKKKNKCSSCPIHCHKSNSKNDEDQS